MLPKMGSGSESREQSTPGTRTQHSPNTPGAPPNP
jgi:hypothetical protein